MPKLDKLIPKNLNGKQFEELCLFDAKYREREVLVESLLTMGRYGVQVSVRKGEGGRPEYTPIRSLPDFEGVLRGGRQFIFDAKTCTQASWGSESLKSFRDRQYRHLKKRQEYGAICFLLIHFNERKLKTKITPAATYALSLTEEAFWTPLETGEMKSISRSLCEEYGIPCEWWTPPNSTKPRPDLLSLLQDIIRETEG